jgi:phosphatidylinositol glycan class C protein
LSPDEFASLTTDDGNYQKNNITKQDVGNTDASPLDADDTYERIYKKFSSKPQPKPLSFLLFNALSVGQEFILVCLLLAGHRSAILEEQYHHSNEKQVGDVLIYSDRLWTSLGLVWITLVLSVVQTRFATSKQYKVRQRITAMTQSGYSSRNHTVVQNKSQQLTLSTLLLKFQHRVTDFLLMAILLRFLSAVLKTLTASYSSDTVYALAIASLFLHLLACDYAYAGGWGASNDHDEDVDEDVDSQPSGMPLSTRMKRPLFKGGTMSLTSAFFATTLLASRLQSNAGVYIFVCCAVVLFALYPAARHLVARKTISMGGFHRFGTSPLPGHLRLRPVISNSIILSLKSTNYHRKTSSCIDNINSCIGTFCFIGCHGNFASVHGNVHNYHFCSHLEVSTPTIKSNATRAMGYCSCIDTYRCYKQRTTCIYFVLVQ